MVCNILSSKCDVAFLCCYLLFNFVHLSSYFKFTLNLSNYFKLCWKVHLCTFYGTLYHDRAQDVRVLCQRIWKNLKFFKYILPTFISKNFMPIYVTSIRIWATLSHCSLPHHQLFNIFWLSWWSVEPCEFVCIWLFCSHTDGNFI